jgi:hypothetical protein
MDSMPILRMANRTPTKQQQASTTQLPNTTD